ncbi:3-keto-disaccharide hydrolase [Rhodospirillaceae bacterium SYSU D60014]|uniref:3-keto-disaccharide hydrolase n=1 Tax=Virgifigura deserti TaxID=2268457 RepID=UPI000E67228A
MSDLDRFADFISVPMEPSDGWAMAGHGRFNAIGDGVIESEGGPGLLWYRPETFADFILRVEWRASSIEDNSGIFLRFPALGTDDPDRDWRRAVTDGYEVQIDDRGHDPEAGAFGSPLHRTGAIYRLAPATVLASRPIGEWNGFEITALGLDLSVLLNGTPVARFDRDVGRPRSGHIGLQNHHAGSRVQFRNMRVRRL